MSFHLGELRAACEGEGEGEGEATVAVAGAEFGRFDGDELPVQKGTAPGAAVDA